MRLDSRHMLRRNVRERLIAPQGVFHENASAVCPTGESALRTLTVSELAEQCLLELNASRRGEPSTDVYGVELLRQATVWADQEAWASLQHCLTEVVRGWLRHHPSREVAARLESEENYVAQAFAHFWQASTQASGENFPPLLPHCSICVPAWGSSGHGASVWTTKGDPEACAWPSRGTMGRRRR
jgi:hypothetical protein